MHRVRMGAVVDEVDAQPLAFVAAQGRTGHLAVVRPGGKEESWRDLDLFVERHDVPLAHHGAIGHRGHFAVVERRGENRGVEPRFSKDDVPNRGAIRHHMVVAHVVGIGLHTGMPGDGFLTLRCRGSALDQ